MITTQPRKLERIVRGIYAIGEIEPTDNADTIVLVHPFYPGKEFTRASYVNNMLTVYRDHPGPIITLEGINTLTETAEIFRNLGTTKNRFFVATKKGTHKLKTITPIHLANFILKNSSRLPVLLSGGYVGACLSSTKEYLESEGISTRYLTGTTY